MGVGGWRVHTEGGCVGGWVVGWVEGVQRVAQRGPGRDADGTFQVSQAFPCYCDRCAHEVRHMRLRGGQGTPAKAEVVQTC